MTKDPAVRKIFAAVAKLRPRYEKGGIAPGWSKSSIRWILREAPATKGAFGKQLVHDVFEAAGLQVERTRIKGVDRVIAGHRVAIRFGRLWEGGIYKFEQLRADRDYEYAVCLGLSPNDAHCWVVSKKELLANAEYHHSRSDYWFSVDPQDPPGWLRSNGTFSRAYQRLTTKKSA